jgi:hypothetical protein
VNNDGTTGWGFSHLTSMPITLSFGTLLLGVIVVLVILRFLFADISVRGGVR